MQYVIHYFSLDVLTYIEQIMLYFNKLIAKLIVMTEMMVFNGSDYQ
jgi:hypothetical protein